MKSHQHGGWIVEHYRVSNKKFIRCKHCNAVIDCEFMNVDENEFDFCPYCGKDMTKGGNDGN